MFDTLSPSSLFSFSERKSDAATDYFTLRQKAVEEKAAERARVREYITMKRGSAMVRTIVDVTFGLTI